MPIITVKGVKHGRKAGEVSSAEILSKWAEENPQVNEWLHSVSEVTRPMYARQLHDFLEWLSTDGANGDFKGYTVKQFLEFQEKASGQTRVTIANRLGMYVSGKASKLRPKSLIYIYTTVRSFFAFHGCDLPKRGFSLPVEHREPAPQSLTYETFIKVLGAAKPRDRAILTVMFQGGMGMREFKQFNFAWPLIKTQLDAGSDYLFIQMTARKKARGISKGFKTIIGRDGVQQLRAYIKDRGEPKPGEPIFVRFNANDIPVDDESVKERSLRGTFERLGRRVQLIEYRGKGLGNRYGYSLHQLRDVLVTQWNTSPADKTVVDYLLGHQVNRNEYLQYGKVEDYLLKEYRKAEPFISPIGNPTPDKVDADEVERLRSQLENLQAQKDAKTDALEAKVERLAKLVEAMSKEQERT